MRHFLLLLFSTCISASEASSVHIKRAEAAYKAGKAAQEKKQFQVAADCFKQAIDIEPTFREAYEGMIASDLDSGQNLEAAAEITRFLQIWPDTVRYRVRLGEILLEQKQAERALAQFSLALRQDRYCKDALLGFVSAAKQLGMNDRARDAMEIGRKHYPDDARFGPNAGSRE